MPLILLLLLTVGSDESNVVTLLIEPPSMHSRSGEDMIRPYSWILHCVRTLYDQMAEVNSPNNTCIKMISTSVCYVSFFLLIQQFIRSRRSLFLRLMLTFSCCLHVFLNEQEFQTDRIPLTDITDFLHDYLSTPHSRDVGKLWAFRPSLNWMKVICVWQFRVIFHHYIADLRDEGSGSADLLASAMRESQPKVDDRVPQPIYQIVKLETVLLPLPTDAEQQCRQLQEIGTCRTSESRQPLLLCSLSAVSSTRTLPWNTPEFSSSSSSVDRFQPLQRESLRSSCDTFIAPPAKVSLFPTTKCTNGVDRCDLFSGSEDHSSYLPACRCTSAALIPSTLVDSKTGGRRLRVSVTNQLKIRRLRLGRLSGCPRNCQRDSSHLCKSEARPGTHRSTEPDVLRVQRKSRCRNCCPVLLFSSSSTQDVGVVIFLPRVDMGYCSSPLQLDDCNAAM